MQALRTKFVNFKKDQDGKELEIKVYYGMETSLLTSGQNKQEWAMWY